MTGEQLVDEVRAIVGRPDDTKLVTDVRVTRWLNEAQRKIVEQVPGLHGTTFTNAESLDTTQVVKYAITDITVGDSTSDYEICRVTDVWYLDGNESRKLKFTFIDEFDEIYPDPTHSDVPKDRPERWTRRGGYIELMPMVVTAYCDKDLRFDGDYYAGDFTTNDASASDISGADAGLIKYAVWQAWEAIGGPQGLIEAPKWKRRWSNPDPLPSESGGWLEGFKAQNDTLHEWDGDLYS